MEAGQDSAPAQADLRAVQELAARAVALELAARAEHQQGEADLAELHRQSERQRHLVNWYLLAEASRPGPLTLLTGL